MTILLDLLIPFEFFHHSAQFFFLNHMLPAPTTYPEYSKILPFLLDGDFKYFYSINQSFTYIHTFSDFSLKTLDSPGEKFFLIAPLFLAKTTLLILFLLLFLRYLQKMNDVNPIDFLFFSHSKNI